MANKTPVKANFTGSDVTSLGEFASGDTIDVSFIADGTITAAKLAADTATQAELDTVSTVASAALPKAGGAMTGAITTNSTFDGVDIAVRDAILTSTTTTAGAALPKAGGTMTGNLGIGSAASGTLTVTRNSAVTSGTVDANATLLLDNTNASGASILRIRGGNGASLIMYGENNSTDKLYIAPRNNTVKQTEFNQDGVVIFPASVTAKTDIASVSSSPTLNFATNQNFILTLTANITLTNPSTETVGQSGFIAFIQDGTGSRTVSLGTDYETAGAAGLTLTSTASATDLVPYLVVASNRILLGTPQLAFA
jgi:hypothetical protein